MNEHIYIIILNWNGAKDTVECLASVKTNAYENFTIVLVDNGSDKGDLEELRTWCRQAFRQIAFYDKDVARRGGDESCEGRLQSEPSAGRLVFIECGENLGFAAGNNVGLQYVLRRGGSHALLLNNDTVITPHSIRLLADFLRVHPEYVAVVPQIRYFAPNNRVWNCGGRITWYGNRRYRYAGTDISRVPVGGFERITFVTGCALLFRPRVSGLLTERFFFGEEDLEFSFRQRRDRRPMACCYSSVVYHKVGASVERTKPSPAGTLYLFYAARLINNRHYSSPLMFGVKMLLHLAYCAPMARVRYKLSLRQIGFILVTLLEEVFRKDGIDKQYWLRYLRHDFRSMIGPTPGSGR